MMIIIFVVCIMHELISKYGFLFVSIAFPELDQ